MYYYIITAPVTVETIEVSELVGPGPTFWPSQPAPRPFSSIALGLFPGTEDVAVIVRKGEILF